MKDKGAIKVACKRAVRNIIREGVSDVALLERPFEIDLLQDNAVRNQFQANVVERVLKNDFAALKVKPIKHILIPKKTLADFRNCAVIDVIDEVVFLSLVLALAREIEGKRIATKWNNVFSYRFKFDEQSGKLFDPRYSFQSFNAEVSKRKRIETNKVMVSCDIASYYDRINLHRLNSTLLSIEGLDSDIIGLIDSLLLFWSGRNSYGLPVGSNASRILAEAELIEVDNFLVDHQVSFCRYVDDYRIFAEDATSANRSLELLVYALKREGLFLNSGKTRIDDISSITSSNDQEAGETKTVDATDVDRPLIITGYSGLIPLKYRKPSTSELERLESFNITDSLQEAIESTLLDSKAYRDLIKATEVQNKFDSILEIVRLTEKCPQFIPYVIDYIRKNKASLSEETKRAIGDYFEPVFLRNETPEFIRVSLSGLYSSDEFRHIDLIVRAYLRLQKDGGEYLGRVFLERLAGKTTRLETLDLRDCGNVISISELRALARTVARGLPSAEANAYLKNLAIHYDDFFINQKLVS